MPNNQKKIGACVMVHNMAPFLPVCLKSLSWVDGIFLYDDHSTDGSLEVAKNAASCQIFCEEASSNRLAFEEGELKVRNYLIDRAFDVLGVDILIILDADEMLSEKIKVEIIKVLEDDNLDSICFSIWHLYDKERYIHFWETKINGVNLIDPHTRIVKRGKHFTPLFEDGSHPTIEPTTKTHCIHGPYHFHLKYFNQSTLPNYSLFFLPERITEADARPYLRPLPFTLSADIAEALDKVDWDSLPVYKATPHYKNERVVFTNPKEALIHPKD
jgi:glycosyltransferase involved in cell wall biosynthesis